jgi:hypothetical protein
MVIKNPKKVILRPKLVIVDPKMVMVAKVTLTSTSASNFLP